MFARVAKLEISENSKLEMLGKIAIGCEGLRRSRFNKIPHFDNSIFIRSTDTKLTPSNSNLI